MEGNLHRGGYVRQRLPLELARVPERPHCVPLAQPVQQRDEIG